MAVRTIDVRERVLAKNDELAADVRRRLREAGVLAFNLVSSPGSGKTALLERTLADLGQELAISVVTGDVQTALDAIDLEHTRLLFIENVGNLVCPASWDLGEDAKVVLFSVTEGEDKPVKYPKMFQQARYAVLSKMDLLPHVPFSVEEAVDFARQVNPELAFFFTSAVRADGMDEWYAFLRSQVRRRSAA